MDLRPPTVRTLLEELEQLPGVGPRTATRLVQHLLRQPASARRMAAAVTAAAEAVHHCRQCFLLAEHDPCPLCQDPARDRGLVCVVEDPLNAWAVEGTGEFGGLYHVLGGTLDPLHGIGPDELTVSQLVARVREGTVREVILATNPTVEGEATAHYLARVLRPSGVKLSRIAFGLPAGGEISYADQVTLTRALAGRRGMD
ncbi:MAG TPA: recombination mediator RecR [Thermoanaerobaculaceae bacterium]|nr:recombination mediator RecR [Thermoanaerobaculaceae bacterium]HPS77395.1 recombination mediator RecR [Thermoanaerobaculaceae bacterium]